MLLEKSFLYWFAILLVAKSIESQSMSSAASSAGSAASSVTSSPTFSPTQPGPCRRFPIGSNLLLGDTIQPQINAVDGVNAFNLHFQERVENIDYFGYPTTNNYYCHMMDDGVHQNPIFRLRAGDRLIITLFNELNMTAADINPPPMDFCGAPNSTETSTNIHFHGTHVNPICHHDEVVKTLVNANQTFVFNYTIPTFQPHGMLWWHPHTYPNARWQIAGGATGVFIVDGIDAVQPLVSGVPERILVFRTEPSHTTSFADPPTEDLSLNFVPILYLNDAYIPPTYAIKPGEVQYWRIGNNCDVTFLDLQLVYDGVVQNFTMVARDDVALGFNNTAETEMGTHWELSPSSRIEILITAPDVGVSSAFLWTLDRSDLLSNPARPLLQLILDINAVTPAPMPSTVVNNVTTMRIPTNLLEKVPVAHRIIDFFEGTAPDGTALFMATPRDQPHIPFAEQAYSNINATQGTVEDWIVNNPTGTTHHFHIHQMHYLLLARNEIPVPLAEQQYYDSIDVVHGTNVTLRIDFTGEDVVGTFVYHCHIMEHSERGMMSMISVLPAPPTMSPSSDQNSSSLPSSLLSAAPSAVSIAMMPTLLPTTMIISSNSSMAPTSSPSIVVSSESPTLEPTTLPSLSPSLIPVTVLSVAPTATPSVLLTMSPSSIQTGMPSAVPTLPPSFLPSASPTFIPSAIPLAAPTLMPSCLPSINPSFTPSEVPSNTPTLLPSSAPSSLPSFIPSAVPSSFPTFGSRSFFVSNQRLEASDSNNGTASAPWRSIRKVNDFGSSVGFGPGDTVFLEGYFTDAPIVLSLTSSFGTAAQPLRFTSWSSAAMATIAYPNQNGFYIYAYGATPLGLGIQIDHLVFRGNGQARSNGVATAGIFLDFQPNSAASIDILIIYNVDISGYMYGITTFRGAAGGFIRDVNITNSVVHDNVEGSTTRSGKGTYSYIGRSGSGIFLSGVQNALIDSVSAFNNGGGSQQNPVGIGIQDSDTVVIRNCTCSAGGGGFELSSGTTNAVIEDSFSLDNGGPGFRVMSESIANLNGVGSCSNITIEGSSSVGDGGINGFYALGVITGPGVTSSNIFFQNMSITVTANDPPFQQFGNSSSIGFTGIYLTGTFDNVETRNASFLFPSSVSYNCDLNCASSQTPSFCECMS